MMMTAVTAAITFPTVKALDPIVPSLDPASRPHWELVGGKVASGVFIVSHVVQGVCAVLAVIALVCLLRSKVVGHRTRRAVSTYATGMAVATLGWYMLVLWPRMRENLHGYWDNVFAGKLEPAQVARKAFDADHPLASNTMGAIFVFVLVALVCAAWTSTGKVEQTR